MKPNKDDLLQEAAAAALKGVPHVKAQQCMYVSLSTLNASPVRVYVETDFCKVPPRKPGATTEEFRAARAEWRVGAQAEARLAIITAGAILKKAGFKFKSVEDYGWAQLTLLGREVQL